MEELAEKKKKERYNLSIQPSHIDLLVNNTQP